MKIHNHRCSKIEVLSDQLHQIIEDSTRNKYNMLSTNTFSLSNNNIIKEKSFYYDEDDDDLFDLQRMSRVSKKNEGVGKRYQNDNKKRSGFFEGILIGLGCISRGTPGK